MVCNSNSHKVEKFPVRLHSFLELASNDPVLSSIVSWLPDGKSFTVHDQNSFTDLVLPVHFVGMNSYKSFRRQLNLYGITKNTQDEQHATDDALVFLPYSHPMMQRHRRDLATKMSRKYRNRDSLTSQTKIDLSINCTTNCGSAAVSCKEGFPCMETPKAQDTYSNMLGKVLGLSYEMETAHGAAMLMSDDAVLKHRGDQDVDTVAWLGFDALLGRPTYATTQTAHCLDCSREALTSPYFADIQQEIINTFCKK